VFRNIKNKYIINKYIISVKKTDTPWIVRRISLKLVRQFRELTYCWTLQDGKTLILLSKSSSVNRIYRPGHNRFYKIVPSPSNFTCVALSCANMRGTEFLLVKQCNDKRIVSRVRQSIARFNTLSRIVSAVSFSFSFSRCLSNIRNIPTQ